MKTSRCTWSILEDEAVANIMLEAGQESWRVLTQKVLETPVLSGRTMKQCRERWRNHLAPGLNKAPWSDEDTLVLFTSQQELGNRWSLIRKRLHGRSENSIKNQFYSSLRIQYKKSKGLSYTGSSLQKHTPSLVKQIISKLKKRVKSKKQETPGQTLDLIDPGVSLEAPDESEFVIIDYAQLE